MGMGKAVEKFAENSRDAVNALLILQESRPPVTAFGYGSRGSVGFGGQSVGNGAILADHRQTTNPIRVFSLFLLGAMTREYRKTAS
jgi:hypothetical protein